jgi:hypothetical protein
VRAASPPPEPDLRLARADVLAIIAGSPRAPHPPAANALAPLRPLAAELAAKLAARVDAGLAALGATSPRSRVWPRVVLPSSLLAAVDAVLLVVAVVTGHVVLAVVTAVLFVGFVALAALGARFARTDPLRLTPAERQAVGAASQWRSTQDWTGPLATSEERGLVMAATRAAERIARGSAWHSGPAGPVDEYRGRLDLGAELDQLDEQAHRIAVARHPAGGRVSVGRSPAIDSAWESALTRVATLTAYADQLRDDPRGPAAVVE